MVQGTVICNLSDNAKQKLWMHAAQFAHQGQIKKILPQPQADDGLRQLRFRLVPKYCSEEQFWDRYFAAVARVKQQVKAEQMWGDFDMLDEDDSPQHGKAHLDLFAPCASHHAQYFHCLRRLD